MDLNLETERIKTSCDAYVYLGTNLTIRQYNIRTETKKIPYIAVLKPVIIYGSEVRKLTKKYYSN